MRGPSAFTDDTAMRTVLFTVLSAAWLKAICAKERLKARAIVDLAEAGPRSWRRQSLRVGRVAAKRGVNFLLTPWRGKWLKVEESGLKWTNSPLTHGASFSNSTPLCRRISSLHRR